MEQGDRRVNLTSIRSQGIIKLGSDVRRPYTASDSVRFSGRSLTLPVQVGFYELQSRAPVQLREAIADCPRRGMEILNVTNSLSSEP